MFLLFFYSLIGGYALWAAMGNPVLFPTHPYEMGRKAVGRRFTFISYALLFAIVFMIKSVLVFTEVYYIRADFGVGSLGKTVHITWSIVLFIALLVFTAVVLVFTWIGKDSILSIHYHGVAPNAHDGRKIIGYIILLIVVLAPQAIADFAGAPEPNGTMTVWAAGLVTIFVELGVWAIVYFAYPYFWNVKEEDFNAKTSGVSWLEFVIIMASVMFVTGLIYFLTMGLALTTFEQLEWLIGGLVGLVILTAFFIGVWPWPMYKYVRAEQTKDEMNRERRRIKKRRNGHGHDPETSPLALNPEAYDLRSGARNGPASVGN